MRVSNTGTLRYALRKAQGYSGCGFGGVKIELAPFDMRSTSFRATQDAYSISLSS